MAKIQKIDLKSKDIKSEQVERLKAIFPEAVADGKINFEQLKATLGEDIEDSRERFGMTWTGKAKCFRIIQDPSTGTLKPCREDSINFDSTKNLFIEGDNLEVLKLLQKSYYEKIKMIYIDPPYNTGKDFVYPDNFGQQLNEYLKLTGQVDDDGKKLSTNTDSNGRFHSVWMNMMYPRLFLARNLLREDGVIFISIDDNEITNLRKVCDEVFGEENFISQITREAIKGGSQSKFIRETHDYILVYAKNMEELEFSGIEQEGIELNLKDEKGPYAKSRELNKWGAGSRRQDAPGMWYPIPGPDGVEVYPIRNDGTEGRWRLGKKRMMDLVNEGEIIFEKRDNGSYIAYQKIRDNSPRIKQFISIFKDEYINAKGTETIKKLFNVERAHFDYSKPTELIRDLMILADVKKDDIVLDFFAGSGTTAHAVLEMNLKDGESRRFICVQLPELTTEETEAFKAGYKNIAEVSKERIRRIINKIKKDNKSQKTLTKNKSSKQDLGFKVFKLDKSNFKIWDNEPSTLQTSLTDHVEQIKKTAKPEEILYEVLLKEGSELIVNIEEKQISNKKVYSLGDDLFMICLEDNLTLELFKEISKLKPNKFIVLDRGFKDNDQLKTNAVQTLGKNDNDEYILRSI